MDFAQRPRLGQTMLAQFIWINKYYIFYIIIIRQMF